MALGIYIHIPFCQSKCNYCHFLTVPFTNADADRYCTALIKEIEIFASRNAGGEEVDSIYFGGGTPSLLPAAHVAAMLTACRRCFTCSNDCEISLEANPGALSAEKIKSFLEMGVNRISMGAQSFQPEELVSIGRRHTPDEIEESLDLLRKNGFMNINLDIMLGLPFQTKESWARTLGKISFLDVPHVSVYMLDLDSQCPLQSMVASGLIQIPDDDLVADLYLRTIDDFALHRRNQYEICNFAKPGFSCRHNLKYWVRDKVQGFGLGSHSFNGQSRQANESQLDVYLHAIDEDRIPVAWNKPVSRAEELVETLFLGLRLNKGVDWSYLQEVYGIAKMSKYEKSLQEMSRQGLAVWENLSVHLTPLGMLLSNEVFQQFV